MEISTWKRLDGECLREFAVIRRQYAQWKIFTDFLTEMGRLYNTSKTGNFPACVQHIAAKHMATLVPQEKL